MPGSQALKYLALKASGAYIQEIQRAVRKETLLLKIAHKISRSPTSRAERNLCQTQLLTLESFMERQEATETYPGDIDIGSRHF